MLLLVGDIFSLVIEDLALRELLVLKSVAPETRRRLSDEQGKLLLPHLDLAGNDYNKAVLNRHLTIVSTARLSRVTLRVDLGPTLSFCRQLSESPSRRLEMLCLHPRQSFHSLCSWLLPLVNNNADFLKVLWVHSCVLLRKQYEALFETLRKSRLLEVACFPALDYPAANSWVKDKRIVIGSSSEEVFSILAKKFESISLSTLYHLGVPLKEILKEPRWCLQEIRRIWTLRKALQEPLFCERFVKNEVKKRRPIKDLLQVNYHQSLDKVVLLFNAGARCPSLATYCSFFRMFTDPAWDAVSLYDLGFSGLDFLNYCEMYNSRGGLHDVLRAHRSKDPKADEKIRFFSEDAEVLSVEFLSVLVEDRRTCTLLSLCPEALSTFQTTVEMAMGALRALLPCSVPSNGAPPRRLEALLERPGSDTCTCDTRERTRKQMEKLSRIFSTARSFFPFLPVAFSVCPDCQQRSNESQRPKERFIFLDTGNVLLRQGSS